MDSDIAVPAAVVVVSADSDVNVYRCDCRPFRPFVLRINDIFNAIPSFLIPKSMSYFSPGDVFLQNQGSHIWCLSCGIIHKNSLVEKQSFCDRV